MTTENGHPLMGGVRKPNCPVCGVEKNVETTGSRITGGKSYYLGICRKCSNTSTRSWRFRDIKQSLLSGAKSRARSAGLPFNITIEDIIIPDLCPALGIPLAITPGQRTDSSPTLDKVHNDMGYVKGNVLVVSWRANRLKNNATIHELLSLANFYANHASTAWMQPHSTG